MKRQQVLDYQQKFSYWRQKDRSSSQGFDSCESFESFGSFEQQANWSRAKLFVNSNEIRAADKSSQ